MTVQVMLVCFGRGEGDKLCFGGGGTTSCVGSIAAVSNGMPLSVLNRVPLYPMGYRGIESSTAVSNQVPFYRIEYRGIEWDATICIESSTVVSNGLPWYRIEYRGIELDATI